MSKPNQTDTNDIREAWDGSERRSNAKTDMPQMDGANSFLRRKFSLGALLSLSSFIFSLGIYYNVIQVHSVTLEKHSDKFDKLVELIHSNDVKDSRTLAFLEAQVAQQIKSDEQFMDEFKKSNENTQEMKEKLSDRINKIERTIIINNQPKTSVIDNTGVLQFAMLTGAY